MSRMTIVVAGRIPLEQITKQLNKLVDVIKIVEQDEDNRCRELALIKVRADASTRVRSSRRWICSAPRWSTCQRTR